MPSGQPTDLSDVEKAAVGLAAKAFNDLREARHLIGQQEYGEYTFLGNDTIRMAIEEVADMCNYMEMTGIKLMLLASGLQDSGVSLSEPFKGSGQGWGQ